MNPQEYASPCGLIANSLFNDEYVLKKNDGSGSNYVISNKDIAWPEDKRLKYGKPEDSESTQWHDPTDGTFKFQNTCLTHF